MTVYVMRGKDDSLADNVKYDTLFSKEKRYDLDVDSWEWAHEDLLGFYVAHEHMLDFHEAHEHVLVVLENV